MLGSSRSWDLRLRGLPTDAANGVAPADGPSRINLAAASLGWNTNAYAPMGRVVLQSQV